jgi:hypothetical protein
LIRILALDHFVPVYWFIKLMMIYYYQTLGFGFGLDCYWQTLEGFGKNPFRF